MPIPQLITRNDLHPSLTMLPAANSISIVESQRLHRSGACKKHETLHHQREIMSVSTPKPAFSILCSVMPLSQLSGTTLQLEKVHYKPDITNYTVSSHRPPHPRYPV